MKKLVTLVLLSIIITSCRNEGDESKAFVQAFFLSSDSITYAGYVSDYEIQTIKELLAKDTLRSFLLFNENGFMNDMLIIDKSERLSIDNQLNELDNKKWYNDLLENSTILSKSRLDSIFKQNTYSGWSYFHKHYRRLKLHHFTRPILLRNNTVCIFYYGYSCDDRCDERQLIVFKKEKNIWKKWLWLSHSIT